MQDDMGLCQTMDCQQEDCKDPGKEEPEDAVAVRDAFGLQGFDLSKYPQQVVALGRPSNVKGH